MNSKFMVIPAIIIGVSILAVFAIDSVNLDNLCAEKGGTRNGDVCLIELPSAIPDVETGFGLSEITVIQPNTMKYFYYPNPEDTVNRDAFQKFILIRLPEELGGGVDDISAFRAYSALSISDHCLMKYWPDEGRKRMEDPCLGSMYRAIDGLLTGGPKPVINTTHVALPLLDLSLDENGSLYVEPPTWTLDENGVIGVGRQISSEEISTGSQILIDSFEKLHPQYPLIPLNFAGHTLSEVQPDGNRVVLRYLDFTSMYGYLTFDIGLATAQDQQYMLNPAKSNSEFWQIGNIVIRIGGNAFEKNNEPDKFKEYEIQFIKDGYNFRVGGKNLEFMKKEIIAKYFPDFEYSDLFLVSTTVK